MDYYLILFLFLSNIKTFYCQEYGCGEYFSSINNPYCFNNILIFDQKKFQANNFAMNKNGDLVVQFSEDNILSSSRLFYGLTKDGSFFFNNQSSYIKEINIEYNETKSNYDFYNYYGIYNSLNLFISLKNDSNKTKEYLFSINPDYSTVELFNFNNNNTYYLWNFYNFFNLDEDDYIFPYEYVLFELKKESTYFIAFIPKVNVYEDMLNITFIKKFRFKSFNIDAYEELNSIKYDKDYLNYKIINIFFMDDYGTFVVIIINEIYFDRGSVESVARRLGYYEHIWAFKFYNHDLKALNYANDLRLIDSDLYDYFYQGGELFFKSIYLKNQYVIFAYYLNFYLEFELLQINYQTELKVVSPIDFKEYYLYNFDIYESLIDFVKIDDKRVVFIYTSATSIHPEEGNLQNNNRGLIILLIDISSDFKYLYIRSYLIFLKNLIPKMQISAFEYNGYLLFSTTAVLQEENSNYYYNYLSLFMKFGYASGNDYDNIDISIYLSDLENNNPTEKFFDLLYENLLIENNIFGYQSDKRIKLVFIPQEIEIFQQDQGTNELIPLNNDSYMYLNDEYILKQNKSLTKSSQYYYIDYQHIIKEPKINIQDNPIEDEPQERRVLHGLSAAPGINNYEFESRTFYGRTNRINFKLCHDYCDTCNELGISDNNQKCLSCLPLYQYDYWYYYNYSIENCVPEGHYFDLETNNLVQCNQTNYKYYINFTDNKKICFKEEYDCPDSYPIFNSSTKECFYCDYFHYKNGECSFDDNNKTAEDIYETIKKKLILDYNNNGEDYLKINTGSNFIYQITSVDNELKYLKGNKKSNNSLIHLKECSDLLKKENGLDPDSDLIILKYENEGEITNGNEKSVQYEIYAPNTTTKLNLSVCSDVIIDIYIPIQLTSIK